MASPKKLESSQRNRGRGSRSDPSAYILVRRRNEVPQRGVSPEISCSLECSAEAAGLHEQRVLAFAISRLHGVEKITRERFPGSGTYPAPRYVISHATSAQRVSARIL